MSAQVQEVVADALPRLLSNLGALKCTFYEVALPVPVEGRGKNFQALTALATLARERRRAGSSFVETLLEVGAEKNDALTVLEAAVFHQSLRSSLARFEEDTRTLNAGRIEELCTNLSANSILVISSLVETKQGARHLPMLDLKLPRTPANDHTAIALTQFVGGGLTLSSGSSYHHYGANLLDQVEFEEWLLRSQLLGGYVDTRWITHQLLEKQAALRVSHNYRAAPPTVIASDVDAPTDG